MCWLHQSVCLSAQPPIRPSIRPMWLAQWLGAPGTKQPGLGLQVGLGEVTQPLGARSLVPEGEGSNAPREAGTS